MFVCIFCVLIDLFYLSFFIDLFFLLVSCYGLFCLFVCFFFYRFILFSFLLLLYLMIIVSPTNRKLYASVVVI